MANDTNIGTRWQDGELDLIVSDYFAMLAQELEGRPYVKAQHSRHLMVKTGRTHKSVEFKYQNVSAVLDELGLPWIHGYKPKRNYQNAIFAAIDRYLMKHQSMLALSPMAPPPGLSFAAPVFVDPPTPMPPQRPMPEPLQRLVRKFDPVERDHRNRSLGRAGEEFVLNAERRRLTDAGRGELARRVRWIAAEDGDGAGYDVLSYDFSGRERLLEVKTTNGSARTPFFLTRNERDLAAERPESWLLYRVHLFATKRLIFFIAPPLEKSVNLIPDTWRASF